MKPNQILQGDVREIGNQIPDQFVNCIVTSVPYWGLRDYGTAQWEGGDSGCDHSPSTHEKACPTSTLGGSRANVGGNFAGFKGDTCPKCGAIRHDNQIGLESTSSEHIETMVSVFRQIRRVLRDDGTLWLNYGDCYATSANGRSAKDTKAAGNDDRTFRDKPFSTVCEGLKPKDLVGMPWRVALALQADGWWLRSDIIWHKPNAMPESVTDRPTRNHEYIFLLTKSERYYYDADSIRELGTGNDWKITKEDRIKRVNSSGGALSGGTGDGTGIHTGRNKRTVWTIPTKPYKQAHFATFPPDLIRPCILAGCPPNGIVLDPFFGSGTVGQVAIETGRQWLGVELNPEYIEFANHRIANSQPALIVPGKKEDAPGMEQPELW